jgi:hypothetical protein
MHKNTDRSKPPRRVTRTGSHHFGSKASFFPFFFIHALVHGMHHCVCTYICGCVCVQSGGPPDNFSQGHPKLPNCPPAFFFNIYACSFFSCFLLSPSLLIECMCLLCPYLFHLHYHFFLHQLPSLTVFDLSLCPSSSCITTRHPEHVCALS